LITSLTESLQVILWICWMVDRDNAGAELMEEDACLLLDFALATKFSNPSTAGITLRRTAASFCGVGCCGLELEQPKSAHPSKANQSVAAVSSHFGEAVLFSFSMFLTFMRGKSRAGAESFRRHGDAEAEVTLASSPTLTVALGTRLGETGGARPWSAEAFDLLMLLVRPSGSNKSVSLVATFFGEWSNASVKALVATFLGDSPRALGLFVTCGSSMAIMWFARFGRLKDSMELFAESSGIREATVLRCSRPMESLFLFSTFDTGLSVGELSRGSCSRDVFIAVGIVAGNPVRIVVVGPSVSVALK
jgi:hypothetical protein